MILFKKAADLRKWIESQEEIKKGVHGGSINSVGFVPTMGALHEGHISLVETAKAENGLTICSIFVNPTQFNDPKDFEKYPITIEKDIEMLATAGCDILFLPSVKEMYPNGVTPAMQYDLGYLETVLEGEFRPGHFQGVCMVVHRLLDIVQPGNLYLGQKDYQQCMVITKLVELMGLENKIAVRIAPTLRENDGLAMSSRNRRLNEKDRQLATTIYKALQHIKKNLQPGGLVQLKQEARKLLEKEGFRIDYVEIAGAKDLSIKDTWDGKEKVVAVVAAFLNEVRLIDNLLLND